MIKVIKQSREYALPAKGEQIVTKGDPGLSAYEVAVANGFVGTTAEWLQSLVGGTKSESGTWTPSFVFGLHDYDPPNDAIAQKINAVFSAQNDLVATYTKIENIVTIEFGLRFNLYGLGQDWLDFYNQYSGRHVYIGGIPFAPHGKIACTPYTDGKAKSLIVQENEVALFYENGSNMIFAECNGTGLYFCANYLTSQ